MGEVAAVPQVEQACPRDRAGDPAGDLDRDEVAVAVDYQGRDAQGPQLRQEVVALP